MELYGLNASFVVMPHLIGNEKVSSFIQRNGTSKSGFKHYRDRHLDYLRAHYEAADVEADSDPS
jgi:hypothetical protein